jgi:hypothetical protein
MRRACRSALTAKQRSTNTSANPPTLMSLGVQMRVSAGPIFGALADAFGWPRRGLVGEFTIRGVGWSQGLSLNDCFSLK